MSYQQGYDERNDQEFEYDSLRAELAAKDAEIEALRAELAKAKDGDVIGNMFECLDLLLNAGMGQNGKSDCLRPMVEEIIAENERLSGLAVKWGRELEVAPTDGDLKSAEDKIERLESANDVLQSDFGCLLAENKRLIGEVATLEAARTRLLTDYRQLEARQHEAIGILRDWIGDAQSRRDEFSETIGKGTAKEDAMAIWNREIERAKVETLQKVLNLMEEGRQ